MGMMQCFLVLVLFCGLALCDDNYKKAMGALRTYQKQEPAFTPNNPVNVSLGLTLLHIREVDETRGEIEMVVYLTESWNDPRLIWSSPPSKGVRVDVDRLWMPDIVAYNQVQAAETMSPDIAVVTPKGSVLYVPSQRIRFQCDLEDFTSSRGSNCTIKYGSWTHSGFDIDLTEPQPPALDEYSGDSRYVLLGVYAERDVARYTCCPEPYVNVKFTFNLKKRGQGLFGWGA